MIEALTEAQWRQWNAEGYLRLGQQLSATDVASLQERCDALMLGTAEDVDYSQLRMVREGSNVGPLVVPQTPVGKDIGHQGPTLEYSKFQGLEHDPVFRALMTRPLFRSVCARVYGEAAAVAVYRATVFNKPAESGGKPIGWHQARPSPLSKPPPHPTPLPPPPPACMTRSRRPVRRTSGGT